jgi:hypothetical protein
MDRERARNAVFIAIERTLALNGMPVPCFEEVTVPAQIPGFKSDDWTYAMVELAEILEITIPDNVNVFADSKANKFRRRSIDEIVEMILRLAQKGGGR